MMVVVIAVATALGVGVGSALVPVLNAEAYVVVAVLATPWLLAPIVVALAVGQTAGKLILYEGARRGSARFRKEPAEVSRRRWVSRGVTALQDRRTAIPVVLAAASIGIPPLALVSVAAGVAHQPRVLFALTCLVGRGIRFAVIAVPAVQIVSRA